MRDFHFPKARPAVSALVALALLLVGTSPQSIIGNVRDFIDFTGHAPWSWFTVKTLRNLWWLLWVLIIPILAWGFWPRRKPTTTDLRLLVHEQESDPRPYKGAVLVMPGENIIRIEDLPFTVFCLFGRPTLTVAREDGRLMIKTLRLFDDRQSVIFRIDRNHIWHAPDVRVERPSPSKAVVFDHNDDEVLNLHLFDQASLIIKRALFRNNGHTLSINEDGSVVLDGGGPKAIVKGSLFDGLGLIGEKQGIRIGRIDEEDAG